ncbi:MAG TPA: hypothetical protein VLJ37_05290 [bacterium]|nr:hypothetical protein [bacterium]
MKAFGVAALLITVGLTAACPQAGPFLAPGGPMGADVSKSVESPADTSDETLTPPPAPPEAGPKGLEMTDGGGPAAGSEQFKRYAGGPLSPIEPKSDEANITVVAYIDARLSYGPNYSQILPESPPMPFLLTKAGAPVTFNFLLELAFAGEDKGDGTTEIWWLPAGLPLDAPNAEGGVVRLVHQPAGTAAAFYCDAQWTNPDPSGTNLSFPPLALGPGKVSFYQYQKGDQDAAHNLIFVKPTDFHPCGGLIPLTTGDPAKPFPPVAPPLMVHPLGSYALIPFKLMTTPLKMP